MNQVKGDADALDGPASDAHLIIQGLSKSYDGHKVIDALSLEVQKGEFVSLLGPSGCGKTTTLRTIAGFIELDEGQIYLNNLRIDQMATHLRGTTMVFQNYALFPHMTVEENIGFGLRMQKIPPPLINQRVRDVLELVKLSDFSKRYPKQLSGGQQQRVALARALVVKPQLLLLDEPLSNLDAKLRKELRAEFQRIHQNSGATTLFVTHDLEEAFSISDKVAVMNNGCIEQYGRPQDIYTNPATKFVAEFVGHTNLFEGSVILHDGKACIEWNGQALIIGNLAQPAENLTVVLPNHRLRLAINSDGFDSSIAAKVIARSYLGSATHYQLLCGDVKMQSTIPSDGSDLIFQPGDMVMACWNSRELLKISA